jgi:ribosome-interacting GTPase 1
MATNVTPQYRKAEEEYRKAQSAAEQVECLQLMLKLVPKHKSSEKLQADLKTRLKEAKEQVQKEKSTPVSKTSYRFPKQGVGQVIIIGAPNCGKSRLLKELTNAEPDVADYPFTTREPMPAMMPWNDVKVQLIDTPPITDTHIEPYIINIVRSADLVLLCFDGSSDDAPEETVAVLEQLESRKTFLSRKNGFHEDDFSKVSIRTILAVTHSKEPELQDRLDFLDEIKETEFHQLQIELDSPESVEELRNLIYEKLDLIRIYTKKPGKPAEKIDPFTIPVHGTVEDLAGKVHKELAEDLKYAKVWGKKVSDGQTVGKDHPLIDGDIVELHV